LFRRRLLFLFHVVAEVSDSLAKRFQNEGKSFEKSDSLVKFSDRGWGFLLIDLVHNVLKLLLKCLRTAFQLQAATRLQMQV
jgi:hypothetical protein